MTADPVSTIRHDDVAAARRHELDCVTAPEWWPTPADARPARSAVVGVLRDAAPAREVPQHPWSATGIEDVAGQVGVARAQLLAAVLVDAGSARIKRGAPGGDVRELVAGMTSLTDHDRCTTLEWLGDQDG